jgi:hypothetical protein
MATSKELDHQYRMAKLQSVTSIARAIVRLLAIGVFAAAIVLCLRALAGHVTFADIRFKEVADLKANRYLGLIASWFLTAFSTSWAFTERRLRKRNIRRVASENSELQTLIDPKRRSII